MLISKVPSCPSGCLFIAEYLFGLQALRRRLHSYLENAHVVFSVHMISDVRRPQQCDNLQSSSYCFGCSGESAEGLYLLQYIIFRCLLIHAMLGVVVDAIAVMSPSAGTCFGTVVHCLKY